MIDTARRDDVAAPPSWPDDRRILLVVAEPGDLDSCLEQLKVLVDQTVAEVVVATPESQPLWWAVVLASGIGPAGIEADDVQAPQREAIDRALARHPEHDGLSVRILPGPLLGSLDALLRDGHFTRSLILTGARTTLRARLLCRRARRWCPAETMALPEGPTERRS
jgi:hypothetical protein